MNVMDAKKRYNNIAVTNNCAADIFPFFVCSVAPIEVFDPLPYAISESLENRV